MSDLIYGNLHNRLMSVNDRAPVVGDGATVLSYSDRHAGTIVMVAEECFVVQLDFVERVDNNGMSEIQKYVHRPNPNGRRVIFRKLKRGKLKGHWREHGDKDGDGVAIGIRDHYHDFSF